MFMDYKHKHCALSLFSLGKIFQEVYSNAASYSQQNLAIINGSRGLVLSVSTFMSLPRKVARFVVLS